MKIRNAMVALLMLQSAVVLAGLLLKQDVWLAIVCYWAILLLKNACDDINEKRRCYGRNEND